MVIEKRDLKGEHCGKVQIFVFQIVMINVYQYFGGTAFIFRNFRPDNGSDIFLRSVGTLLRVVRWQNREEHNLNSSFFANAICAMN